jgi:hypothetical protein
MKNRDVSQGAYDRSLDDVKRRVALDILAEVRRKRLELSFESSNVERLNDRQEGGACLRWSAPRNDSSLLAWRKGIHPRDGLKNLCALIIDLMVDRELGELGN